MRRIIPEVEVWLTTTNTPVTFRDVVSIYEIGSFTAFHVADGKVHKYNTAFIWRIVHPYGAKGETLGQTSDSPLPAATPWWTAEEIEKAYRDIAKEKEILEQRVDVTWENPTASEIAPASQGRRGPT